MSSKTQEMIMIDAPGLVRSETVQIWMPANWTGSGAVPWYRTEAAARQEACTHRACAQCGAPAPKWRKICGACGELKDQARYLEWAEGEMGEIWAVSLGERYFFDEGELIDHLCEHADEEREDLGLAYERWRPVVCDRVEVPQVDLDCLFQEWWEDFIASDDLPQIVLDAAEAFNAVLQEHAPPSHVASDRRLPRAMWDKLVAEVRGMLNQEDKGFYIEKTVKP